MQRDAAYFEQQRALCRQPCRHQILDHFMLGIDGNGLAGQLSQVDAVTGAIEGQLYTVMQCALAAHALAYTSLGQDIHRALLQHAGADGAFYIRARARFEDDRFYASKMQQVG